MTDREAAFTEYVQDRADALLRTAVFLCAGDRHTAEELMQEALARAYVSWDKLRVPEARDAYVRRIMVRHLPRVKASRRDGPPELVDAISQRSDADPDPYDQVAGRIDLWPYLIALPPRQRAVVVLRYYEDLSESDIAAAVGCSPGAVKSHASRALKSLRLRLTSASHPASVTGGFQS